jgi:protocatechuate 3,4-dioxygenase alpha subunit
MLELTPSQTVGPFFHDELLREARNVVAGPGVESGSIRIEGRVYDGDGAPIDDAMVEIWQADAEGRYLHPADERGSRSKSGFIGFGRSGTDESGRYWFETIKPGPVSLEADQFQAPHINVQVFARGLLDHLTTRIYFSDEAANSTDRVLSSVEESRRHTLIAERSSRDQHVVYNFDIILQGHNETVFFDA